MTQAGERGADRIPPPFANVRGHHFLAAPINHDSVVLDLGANHGDFSKGMASRFGCRPYLVEANPILAESLQATGSFPVLHCAAASENGALRFNIAKNDEGSSVLPLPDRSDLGCTLDRSVDVEALTLETILDRHGLSHVDLLKMDIEGAEVALLETCPPEVLRRIDQIAVEFHCAPVFGFGQRHRVEAVMQKLASLGFSQYVFIPDYTDVLFVSHGNLGTSLLQQAMLGIRTRRPRWLRAIWQAVPPSLREQVKRTFGRTRD